MPRKCGEEDERVDGGHARVEEQRRQDGTINVMDDIYAYHGPIGPRQVGQAFFGRDRGDAIQDGQEAGNLHEEPGPFTREVEFRIDAGFALGIPGREPLRCGQLSDAR